MASVTARHARGNVVMYHTAPASRLKSILHSGILPALSRGARPEAWLTTPGRLGWAVAHVRARHGCVRVVSLRVLVPRSSLTRRRPGVWTTSRRIGPDRIMAVNVVSLLSAAAAA
jgi:hypothetical protein